MSDLDAPSFPASCELRAAHLGRVASLQAASLAHTPSSAVPLSAPLRAAAFRRFICKENFGAFSCVAGNPTDGNGTHPTNKDCVAACKAPPNPDSPKPHKHFNPHEMVKHPKDHAWEWGVRCQT